MPRDISSSSSEDEEDNNTTKSPLKEKESDKKASRYQCPADFVSFQHKPCSSTLTESLKNNKNELWLIKAPASFDPECFSGIKVPLSGLQTLKVPAAAGGAKTGSSQQIYSVLASTHGTSELRLLTSDKQSSDSMVFGPMFSGLLNVCESYGDSSTNQAPQVIPAAPAPSVAKRLVEETWREEEEEDGKKKKKKKKKEKRIKTEQEEEVVRVKQEPAAETQDKVMTELPLQEGEVSEEKRKKKKKKRDREREEVEEGLEPSVRVKEEEVTVKCEPIDTLYGDLVEGSGKKKKKKKKSKTDDE
ncbi:CD3e molecule, epsilon associated protein [Plectropomus leopardus]|uniref:CD3e molecule, epsilon associated protein n=1 Tax=Plectropomus leopardus TaxID=160734 RepID=UPI001C4DB2B3|nr:CD3e molecule, epsilon associated protein [Plectropomus leopardus]